MNSRFFEDKSVFRRLVKYVTESFEQEFYNDREGAEKSLRERIEGAKNDDPENCLVLGLMLIEIGEYGYALTLLRVAADGGMVDAQTVLGKVLTGDEAEKYTRMAADKGYEQAWYNLGSLLEYHGKYKDSAEYYRLAAEMGDSRAQTRLPFVLRNCAVELQNAGNLEKAAEYYRMAADAGDSHAQTDLDELLGNNNSERVKKFRAAADSGDADAQYEIGVQLESEGNPEEAEKYLRMAAEQGHIRAQYELGELLWDNDESKEAEKYLRMAAEQGDSDAQYELGNLLEDSGKIEEAEKYLRMAAEQGNYHAQYCLGEMFRKAGNFEEAEKYYLMAGNSGSIIALGTMYEELGDADKAETYYLKEAERNNADAQYHLAKLYEKQGKSDEAKKYYYSAAKFGSDDAEDALKRLTANESDNTLSALFEDEDELERVINTIVIKMPDLVKKVGDIRSYINRLYDDANAGSADARCDLSYMLMCVDSDRYFEATEGLLLAAAEQGAAKAQYVLGYMYDSWGKTGRAQKYYRLAEEQNSADAQAAFAALLEKMKMKMNEYELAEQYRRLTAKQGHSDTRQNPEHADSAENQVSSEQVDYDALAERGTELLNTGNFDEAEKCLRPAAEHGNPQGVFMYGYLCMVRGNFDSARKYLNLAAEKGNIAAQNILKNLP